MQRSSAPQNRGQVTQRPLAGKQLRKAHVKLQPAPRKFQNSRQWLDHDDELANFTGRNYRRQPASSDEEE